MIMVTLSKDKYANYYANAQVWVTRINHIKLQIAIMLTCCIFSWKTFWKLRPTVSRSKATYASSQAQAEVGS